MSHLYEASKQWAQRPADQRYWSLQEMYDHCRGYAAHAREATVRFDQLTCAPGENGNLCIVGPQNNPATLTHWSFGQLANRIGAPAGYLATLPGQLAADCINNGLQKREERDQGSRALMHSNGSLVCRAFTSDDYSRIWNHDVIKRLLDLPAHGWQVPPARPAHQNQPGARLATAEDVLANNSAALSIKIGDPIAPAGLYASDHDMFAFMVNEQNRIDDGTPGGLARGFFVSNSEVGAAAFKITRFLYKFVCGNHIVWHAKDVKEIRIVHRGRNNGRYGWKMIAELRRYADESAAADEGRIEAARRFQIGGTKDEVLDKLFGMKSLGIARKTLEAAYDHVVKNPTRYNASPRSAYGMVNGLTAISQEGEYTDQRVDLDRAAGKVLSMAF